MRVLLISNMYAYPGNWDKLDQLGELVELAVVTPDRWTSDRELHPVEVTERYRGDAWRHWTLPTLLQGNPFRYVYRPRSIARVFGAFKPDIVHVEQEPESLSLLQIGLLKRRFPFRLLFVAWENINPIHKGIVFRWANFALADGAIFGNTAALERCRAYGFRKPAAVIPQYGFGAVPRVARSSGDGPLKVGYAGRLVPEKGLPTLVAAIHAVPGTELVVAGEGPLAASIQNDAQVRWLGRLQRDSMADFWAEIDVFVLPSLTTRQWAEQFGRVLGEAMAHGVPVIGSDSGAIPEVIGDAGLVFPEDDVGGLAAAITRVRAPEVRAELSAKGYRRVREAFAPDVVMRKTVDFYELLLERRSA